MSNKELSVKKRNGLIQPLMLDKLHLMVEEACRGLSGVSVSQVEMNSHIQFYDGITTDEIQQILIKSASDLISLDAPNYQYVAARLLLFSIRKQVYGGSEMPHLIDHINKCVELNVYDSEIYQKYNKEEIENANSFIDHERDFIFTYAALKQAVDKYLCQDRDEGIVYETPQFMYIMIALVGFADYDKDKRMSYVKRFYDVISTHKINLPTPVMASVRTPEKQYSSCTLLECDDTLDSICAVDWAMRRYVANKSGIGLDPSRVRSLKSKIRGGKVLSTGKVKYIQAYEKSLESVHQGGLRKGSMTCFVNIWDKEIEKIIELKNETGNEEDSARNIDYAVKMSRLFYQRFINNQDISLFCPNDVPGLIEVFGLDGFDELYEQYEKDESIKRLTVNCQDLIVRFFNSRNDTGRYYIMNIDHCNTHSSFLDKINMSNLCVAGDTKIKIKNVYPLYNDVGEIFDWRVFEEEVEIQELGDIIEDRIYNITHYCADGLREYDDTVAPPLQVLSYDFEKGEDVWRNITAFAETSPNAKVMRITDEKSGNSLVLTPEHKIYTVNKGYIEAGNITPYDMLLFTDGNSERLKIESLEEEIPVYDITVEETHNFYANDILVHNCMEITLPTVPIQHIDDIGTISKVKVKAPKSKVNEFNRFLKTTGGYLL